MGEGRGRRELSFNSVWCVTDKPRDLCGAESAGNENTSLFTHMHDDKINYI